MNPNSILETTGDYDLTVLAFYRGIWCPFCQSHLRELNDAFNNDLRARNGRLIAVSAQSDELSQATKDEWNLTYDVVSDPSTELAQRFSINVTPKDQSPLAEHPTEYPNGMSQSGVVALNREGEVIYHWAVDPTETNLFGASDRPLPAEIWQGIDAGLAGTAVPVAAGARLNPEFLAANYPEQYAAFEAYVAENS